ncbi:beta-carotene 15,15'-monooxygenase [Bacillus sp. E214]|uniref:beta-carotene 15,15'-monooxygenase n=1 Tax=Bacillus sp. E214 TaxID=2587156 RepID=UPI0021CC5C54|nr:beta-carotene 15,15'-monooxygenase [Bacillus sp. E214]
MSNKIVVGEVMIFLFFYTYRQLGKSGIVSEEGVKTVILKKSLYREFLLIMLFLLVLISNVCLYRTAFGVEILQYNPNGAVVGSIIDLALVLPVLFMAWKRSWGWKNMILLAASGLVLVRFLIPMEYLAPFESITWVGFLIEGLLVCFEVLLIVSLFKYMPYIIRAVKNSPLPVVFSFSNAVEKKMKKTPVIIQMICSEMLVFYYAFASWNKKMKLSEKQYTLHQKSSYIAFQVMLIHAIVFETAAIHWWLHEKYFLLSMILLLLNLYSVILFVADIQAVRLNPLKITGDHMYISLGLMKRMEIKWTDIESIIDEQELLKQKVTEKTIEFISRDLEEVYPDVILKLKHPIQATLILGIKKEYEQVAIRLDEPERFKVILREKVTLDRDTNH